MLINLFFSLKERKKEIRVRMEKGTRLLVKTRKSSVITRSQGWVRSTSSSLDCSLHLRNSVITAVKINGLNTLRSRVPSNSINYGITGSKYRDGTVA